MQIIKDLQLNGTTNFANFSREVGDRREWEMSEEMGGREDRGDGEDRKVTFIPHPLTSLPLHPFAFLRK
jgi:hypothetical protein